MLERVNLMLFIKYTKLLNIKNLKEKVGLVLVSFVKSAELHRWCSLWYGLGVDSNLLLSLVASVLERESFSCGSKCSVFSIISMMIHSVVVLLEKGGCSHHMWVQIDHHFIVNVLLMRYPSRCILPGNRSDRLMIFVAMMWDYLGNLLKYGTYSRT